METCVWTYEYCELSIMCRQRETTATPKVRSPDVALGHLVTADGGEAPRAPRSFKEASSWCLKGRQGRSGCPVSLSRAESMNSLSPRTWGRPDRGEPTCYVSRVTAPSRCHRGLPFEGRPGTPVSRISHLGNVARHLIPRNQLQPVCPLRLHCVRNWPEQLWEETRRGPGGCGPGRGRVTGRQAPSPQTSQHRKTTQRLEKGKATLETRGQTVYGGLLQRGRLPPPHHMHPSPTCRLTPPALVSGASWERGSPQGGRSWRPKVLSDGSR